MRHNLLPLIVLSAVSALGGCGEAPRAVQDRAGEEAKLRADAIAFFQEYDEVDAEGVARLFAEDAMVMPPGAPAVSGRQAIRVFYGEDAARSKAAGFTLKNASVTGAAVEGDMGWVSGTYVLTDASGTTIDTGNYLSVHRNTDGSWLYLRDIWNSDRRR